MIQNDPSNVSSAFEMLLEEVEAEIDFVTGVGSKAVLGREYDKAREALDRAGQFTAFRDKVAALRREWNDMAAAGESQEDEETKAARRNLGKLRKGLRTPESHFHVPILEVLQQMGGSGSTGEVLDRVGRKMKSRLQKVDYEPLASDSKNLRWRNTAQWARNSMVHEGLLKSDSPRGVWELADKGRKVVEKLSRGQR